MKNNILKESDAIKFARYKIYWEYYGLFDQCNVIAFANSLIEAKMIVNALNEYYENRPMEFSYVLCAEFDEVLDTDYD